MAASSRDFLFFIGDNIMGKWLKGCEICNAGLINKVDELVEKKGISINKACQLMEKEVKNKFGDDLYTAAAIRARYLFHKGLKDKKVVQTVQLNTNNPEQKQEVIEGQISKTKNQPQPELLPQEEVEPEPDELSADYHVEAIKASAQANEPKPSELEKAAKAIKNTAHLLERIIEGKVPSDGKYDALWAESIKRYGPSIIISFYQLGIDPEKAIKFYQGESNYDTNNIERNLRIT